MEVPPRQQFPDHGTDKGTEQNAGNSQKDADNRTEDRADDGTF